jgi:hypothetical protein
MDFDFASSLPVVIILEPSRNRLLRSLPLVVLRSCFADFPLDKVVQFI